MVMMYVRFPRSLRNVEDLLFQRGIDICQETEAAVVLPPSAICNLDTT